MKTFITAALCALLALLVLVAVPTSGEEAVYESTLRLHVIAASDSTEDQTVKLLVKDAVLAEHGERLLTVESKEAAEEYLTSNLSAIEKTVRNTLSENGVLTPFSVTVGEEYFDTRTYGDVTLPAGKYTALKIAIGEGKGQNFWCMLYPALCVAPALGEQMTAEEAYKDTTYTLVTNSYAIRFRTLELLSTLLE